MKNVHLLQLLIFLSVCFACRQNQTYVEENWDITYICIDSLSNENIIIKNKEKHRFVKLETTKDCLIAKIERMDFDDRKMFVKDSNDKIFVFDENGLFLNGIGQKGPGPDEHYSIYDFYLDKKNKRICVFDMFKSCIFSYSYTGALMEKKPVNPHIFKDFSHTYLVDEHTLLLVKINSVESRYNYSLVSGKNFDRVAHFVPYLFIGEKWSQSEGRLPVTESGSQIYMKALISDTIYRYDAGTKSIVPDMVFKGKYRPMTKKDVEGKALEIGLDALQTAKEKKLSYGIADLHMTNKYITYYVQDYQDVNRVIWNIETKRGNIFKLFDASVFNNFFSYLITATDDAFVCPIPAEEFVLADWKENESARKAAENTLEDDNPVIAFYYFD